LFSLDIGNALSLVTWFGQLLFVVLWHLAESKQVALFFEAFASQLVFAI
jgi:hypothetical protein